ncbi:hypothetical protein EYF80_000591 [Liparis tanakae]|uniref:Uncharacterized protein n=1 Tax=Liparis tanakae TaxID=230148 RepID=A0A4Z2JHM5_9TELE|nr:hypothetical protein EYF80_000591 [Liparis tanakae]
MTGFMPEFKTAREMQKSAQYSSAHWWESQKKSTSSSRNSGPQHSRKTPTIRLYHGGVTLHGDQKQAEYGCSQGHEQHAFPEEPQSGGEAKRLAAGHTDVDQVGSASEEVTECDVGDADVNPAPAVADAGDDGQQHHQILQDDENTEEEEAGRGGADVVLLDGDGSVLQAVGVVVVTQDHTVDLARCSGGVAGITGRVVQLGAGGGRASVCRANMQRAACEMTDTCSPMAPRSRTQRTGAERQSVRSC